MRYVILTAMLATSPAQAATLRCVVAEVCINDQCKPASEPDQSFLLINPDGPAPIYRSEGDTRMTKLDGDAPMKWQGTQSLADDQIRVSMTLSISPSDLTYALEIFGEFGQGLSTGQCTGLPSGHLY